MAHQFPPLKNDLLLRAARGEQVERTPIWIMRQAGRYLPEFHEIRKHHGFFEVCRTPELACALTLQPIDRYGSLLDASIIFSDILVIPQALGLEVKMVEGRGPVFTEPLETPDDISRLKEKIDVNQELGYVYEAITLTRMKLDGRVPLLGFVGAPWTLMAYMIEGGGSKTLHKAKSWLWKYPEQSHRLLQRITDVSVAFLVGQVKAGAQMLQVFDSWGGELGPEDFKQHSLPYIAQIASRVKEQLDILGLDIVPMTIFAKGSWYALEDLSSIGYDVVSLDWTIDPQYARKVTKDRVVLQGNMDPTSLYAPDDAIREIATRMVKGFGKDAKYIANLGHGILPTVNPDSLKVYLETVQKVSEEIRNTFWLQFGYQSRESIAENSGVLLRDDFVETFCSRACMDITKYFSKAGGGTQSSSTKKEEKTKAADKPATRTTSKADKKDENAGATLATGRKKRAVIHSDDDDDVVMIDTKKVHDEGRKRTKKEAAKKEEEVDPNSYFASAKKGVKAVPTKKEDDKAIIVEEEKDDKSRKTKSKETPVNVKKEKPAASKSASKKRARVVDDDDDGDEDDYEFEPIEDDFDDELEIVEKKESKESPKKPAAKGKVKEEKPKQEKAKENKKTESEDGEKKKSSLWQLKNRLPPQQLGTREIPTAEPNCFGGSTFVVSGEFESLTRSQTEDLIKRYGGRLTTGVSGKTTYFLKGRDAGPSKTEKAESLGTKILDEDGFFELLKKSKSKEVEMPAMPAPVPSTSKGKQKDNTDSSFGQADQLWTEKYKPTKIEEILGNKELVKRISNWLKDWDSNRSKFKFRNKEDINDFGAVLMSGPPGIGKTTAAHVVAKTNDYELLEFNASDVRNKKILEESVSEMMDNRTMTEFFVAGKPKSGDRLIKGKKVVLVMDEVDGMSAGDRGGAAEMAKLIKNSKIPVICICNDIRSKKIEPLLRVCYEAKFKRTPAAQLRARLMTIAFRENLKMEANAVDQLVEATRNDVRQIINIMSTYRLGQQSMNFDQAKAVGKVNEKYSQINLFDIPGILLSGSKNREMTLAQKSEIYFHDYSLSPLMFFENYFRWMPESAKAAPNQNEMELRHIDAIANAADAMSEGAMVDGMIHGSTQHWSLMPVHSMFSLVRPAHFMNGIFAGPHRINFPAWLGQNSKAGKRKRLLREIQIHMRTKSSGDKYEVRQSYLPVLNQRIYSALLEEDYDTAIEIMDSYFLDKDLVDAIAELEYPLKGQKTLASQLNTKQKTTFTKTYNAGSHPVMLQPGGQTIKKAIPVAMDDPEGTIFEEEGDFGGDVSEEEATPADDDTNLAKDKYIKTKELSAGGKGGKTAAKAGTKRKTAPASSSSKAKKKK